MLTFNQAICLLAIKLPCDPAIPLIYPEELKSGSQRNECTPMFTTAPLAIIKMQNQPKCPLIFEWIKKYCRYLKMDYHPALKGNYAICDNMDEH